MRNTGMLMVALTCCLVPSAYAASGTDTSKATTTTRKLRSGAVLEFSSDAKYEMGDQIQLQLAPTGADKTPVQVIKLSAGRISVRLPEPKNPKHPQHGVMIEGPRKVSAIAKGGESVVIATNERVTIAAVKGEMLTALGNSWRPLVSGLVRSFAAGASIDQPVPVAPKLSATKTMLLALRGGPSTTRTTVKASPTPNVDHHELSVYRLDGAARSLVLGSEWRSDARELPDLPAGRYEVVAHAVDRFGVKGPPSKPLTLRVVGVELPEGARMRDDTILLGREGRVRLVAADGLEFSYGRSDVFLPAPKDVGLAGGKSTLLRLREPGSPNELRVPLEPRALTAVVAIGPTTARWPGTPLEVSVKLFDRSGKPVTDTLKTTPRVFVNVEAVEPTWTHTGNTYTAKVAPRTGAGPWVVRVVVKDDFGELAGRDFIELGGS